MGNNCKNNKSKHMANHNNDDVNNKPNLGIFKNHIDISIFSLLCTSVLMPNTNETSKIICMKTCTKTRSCYALVHFITPRMVSTLKVNSKLYRLMASSLIYVTNMRTNICFAISYISRYMVKP